MTHIGSGASLFPSWYLRAVESGSTLLTGLEHYWALDEASGTRADSVGEADLTDNNTVGYVCEGPSGTVANFVAASGEYLTRASNTDLAINGAKTYAVWYRLAADGVQELMNRTGGGEEFNFYVNGSSAIQAWIKDSSSGYSEPAVNTASRVSVGQWHVAWFWYNPADKKGYVALDMEAGTAGAALTNGPATATSTFSIGIIGGTTYPFGGQMARAAVWNEVLSAEDRAEFFNSGSGVAYADLSAALKTNLVSWWDFSEASGTRVDSHGDNDLTDNETVGSTTSTAGAMHNTAASFVAGSLEYLGIASPVIPSDSDFTVAHWQYLAAGEAATGMLAWKTHAALQDDQHGIFFEPANGANHRIYNRRGYGTGVEIGDNRGNWILVVYEYVHATTTTRVMGLGTAANSGVWSADSVAAVGNNTTFSLGGPDATIYMNGLIDEVAIWSRVLTEDERTELYASGAGKFYPFEE